MDTIPADLETLVFEKSRVNERKLRSCGFQRTENGWKKTIPFHAGEFEAVIRVSTEGTVSGTVYETALQEEYLPLRVASQTSAFVSTVRQEYYDLLTDLRDQAFDDQLFHSAQANRIATRIAEEYGDGFDHPFKKYPDFTCFRVPGSQKWYGLVMQVERSKVQKDASEGSVEIINLRTTEAEVGKLTCETGIYPAWHMSKKSWVSVLLDDTLKDDRIFALIQESRRLVSGAGVPKAVNEWIVPSNPKYYDIRRHFRLHHTAHWKQSIRAHVGDIVYIYSGAPDSAILYKTVVVETDIPSPYQDAHLKMRKVMKLKVLKQYPPELLTMKVLRTFGVRSMQGSKHVPLELKQVIDRLEEID